MKLVADLLQVRVVASGLVVASVLGEAYMVGLGIGVLGCPADLATLLFNGASVPMPGESLKQDRSLRMVLGESTHHRLLVDLLRTLPGESGRRTRRSGADRRARRSSRRPGTERAGQRA